MTKFQLLALLTATESKTVTIGGVTGILSGIRREDGSGRSFLVDMLVREIRNGRFSCVNQTVFVRTTD